jgi:hypothetical protein
MSLSSAEKEQHKRQETEEKLSKSSGISKAS